MLPVLSSADLQTGIRAVASAVYSRLNLFRGEWWENRDLGFALPSFLIEGIRTESDAATLANYITAYIAATPGVTSVSDVTYSFDRSMTYSCSVHTVDDAITMQKEILLP